MLGGACFVQVTVDLFFGGRGRSHLLPPSPCGRCGGRVAHFFGNGGQGFVQQWVVLYLLDRRRVGNGCISFLPTEVGMGMHVWWPYLGSTVWDWSDFMRHKLIGVGSPSAACS
ncbi:unnamed protein product [Taenia asiatica]|uniref:Secreted protein n=1 Tax=Taenia asiatica TaxID=60517 RepID=A0A0R3W175_TAEAS|nr:unnamed protein product [Taenia asiatica]